MIFQHVWILFCFRNIYQFGSIPNAGNYHGKNFPPEPDVNQVRAVWHSDKMLVSRNKQDTN